MYGLDIRFCSIWHELRIGMTSSERVWRHKSIFSGQNLRKCSILSNLHCVCMNSYSSPNVFYGLDIRFARFDMVYVSVWRHRYDNDVINWYIDFWVQYPRKWSILKHPDSLLAVIVLKMHWLELGLTICVCLIWHDLRVGVTSSIRLWRRKLICWGSYKGKYSTHQATKKQYSNLTDGL